MAATSACLVRFGFQVAGSEIPFTVISVALARSEVYTMTTAIRVDGESARLVRPAICVARIEVCIMMTAVSLTRIADCIMQIPVSFVHAGICIMQSAVILTMTE